MVRFRRHVLIALLAAPLAGLAMGVSLDTDSAPTEPSYKQFDQMKKLVDEQLSGWMDLQRSDLAAFQKMAVEDGIPPVMLAPADRAKVLQELAH